MNDVRYEFDMNSRRLLTLLTYIALGIGASGCSTLLRMPEPPAGAAAYRPGTAGPQPAGILLTTHSGSRLHFRDGWSLTWSGVAGSADLLDDGAPGAYTDTTISYYEVKQTTGTGRHNTMRQFLLTILGVILIIGLAAIILYAAFIATDR
ncbi:MAG: hypothetical protein CL946_01960 [Ectothiorhodospiraceae bacterium]|nr:hypothetical protein [Ectothiorhodospiraceae bacterium]